MSARDPVRARAQVLARGRAPVLYLAGAPRRGNSKISWTCPGPPRVREHVLVIVGQTWRQRLVRALPAARPPSSLTIVAVTASGQSSCLLNVPALVSARVSASAPALVNVLGLAMPGAGERPGQRPADRLQNRQDRLAEHRPDRIDNRQEWTQNRQQRRQEVRDQFRGHHYDHRHWYGDDFWRLHPHAHWRFHAGFPCWRWATWGAVTTWLPYAWSQPVYYNYGDNVYYQDDSVYYGDQVVATSEEYTQQAEQIATSVPEVSPDDVEWMPLGVFALTQDGQASGPDPTLYLQLAVSKEGILAGTIQNTATDEVQSIEGMVDQESQRAAWTVVDKTRPIMETGIINLTEDSAPALVHFEDGQTQQWLMVRLEQPTDQAPQ